MQETLEKCLARGRRIQWLDPKISTGVSSSYIWWTRLKGEWIEQDYNHKSQKKKKKEYGLEFMWLAGARVRIEEALEELEGVKALSFGINILWNGGTTGENYLRLKSSTDLSEAAQTDWREWNDKLLQSMRVGMKDVGCGNGGSSERNDSQVLEMDLTGSEDQLDGTSYGRLPELLLSRSIAKCLSTVFGVRQSWIPTCTLAI